MSDAGMPHCEKCHFSFEEPRLSEADGPDYFGDDADTPALLIDRGKTHGEFGEVAAKAQRLKTIMAGGRNWEGLRDTQRLALEAIAYKIARILTGDPEFRDHWIDIAGYAKLVVDELGAVEGREPRGRARRA